jgi:hypothetical protein
MSGPLLRSRGSIAIRALNLIEAKRVETGWKGSHVSNGADGVSRSK